MGVRAMWYIGRGWERLSATERLGISTPEVTDPLPPDCHPKLRRLFDYWQSIRPADKHLPGRQHFDPLQLRALLPQLWLLDVHRDPLRFRYRLVGTEHVAAMGTDPTGEWYDDAHPALLTSPMYPKIVAAAEQGIPVFRRGPPTIHVPAEYLYLETLLVPLAADGEAVDILVGVTIYGVAPRPI
jgi:hypothetical protein